MRSLPICRFPVKQEQLLLPDAGVPWSKVTMHDTTPQCLSLQVVSRPAQKFLSYLLPFPAEVPNRSFPLRRHRVDYRLSGYFCTVHIPEGPKKPLVHAIEDHRTTLAFERRLKN